jgi:hypothetical protein
MATEAARLKTKKPLIRKRKTVLTLTGLLMEGLGPAPHEIFSEIHKDQAFVAATIRARDEKILITKCDCHRKN